MMVKFLPVYFYRKICYFHFIKKKTICSFRFLTQLNHKISPLIPLIHYLLSKWCYFQASRSNVVWKCRHIKTKVYRHGLHTLLTFFFTLPARGRQKIVLWKAEKARKRPEKENKRDRVIKMLHTAVITF